MKKITTTSYKALSLIFTTLSINSNLAAPSLIGGTIQFSKNSTLVPLNMNYSGTQITTATHETSLPKITFEIPKATHQTHFEVLVTAAKIEYQLKQYPDKTEIINTFAYLKINPESSYKYYVLDLIDSAWEIKEETLPESGQIPDRAIIVECYPEWISEFKGGSTVELPTLYVNNATDRASEENFEEALIKLELTALDSKIIHAPIKRQIQTVADKKRILIMDTIT
ncbi:MAG TPA: hypothetical protein VHX42_00315 [Candidatus Babeliales bacterium]|jgi:hypothetical protein|nr:hypothetical protein [Candidatus Babeliales bacterium]